MITMNNRCDCDAFASAELGCAEEPNPYGGQADVIA
jgi:hypothetical protein